MEQKFCVGNVRKLKKHKEECFLHREQKKYDYGVHLVHFFSSGELLFSPSVFQFGHFSKFIYVGYSFLRETELASRQIATMLHVLPCDQQVFLV